MCMHPQTKECKATKVMAKKDGNRWEIDLGQRKSIFWDWGRWFIAVGTAAARARTRGKVSDRHGC